MNFYEWISAKCSEVNQCEARGAALLEAGNSEGYRNIMRAKAELLASLDADAGPYLAQASPAVQGFAADTLRSFSASAKNALKLDSVFYMSALLFPDEHKPGEPHNLDRFLEELDEFE